MGQILGEAERTSRPIDSLLLLARADAGEDGFQRELTEVSTVLREALVRASSLAAERRIGMASDLSSEPIVVHGDGEALRRLFLILVDNAVKYTPAGGHVHVRLEASDGN